MYRYVPCKDFCRGTVQLCMHELVRHLNIIFFFTYPCIYFHPQPSVLLRYIAKDAAQTTSNDLCAYELPIYALQESVSSFIIRFYFSVCFASSVLGLRFKTNSNMYSYERSNFVLQESTTSCICFAPRPCVWLRFIRVSRMTDSNGQLVVTRLTNVRSRQQGGNLCRVEHLRHARQHPQEAHRHVISEIVLVVVEAVLVAVEIMVVQVW